MRKLGYEELTRQRLSHEELLSAGRHPVTLILEDIRSMYNVGSIFRTADAARLHELILCGYTPTPPRKEIAKTALGATETVPWRAFPTAAEAVLDLRARGVHVYALEQTDRSMALTDLTPAQMPIALVLGNEIGGVSAATLAVCDGAIEIPMYGTKHSFNVAVAAGIAAMHAVQVARSSFAP
jgi:tRNA G18 (ribose-2'-O)-methylase SpoU